MPLLRDDAIYLAVDMAKNKKSEYALIEVPTDQNCEFCSHQSQHPLS